MNFIKKIKVKKLIKKARFARTLEELHYYKEKIKQIEDSMEK